LKKSDNISFAFVVLALIVAVAFGHFDFGVSSFSDNVGGAAYTANVKESGFIILDTSYKKVISCLEFDDSDNPFSVGRIDYYEENVGVVGSKDYCLDSSTLIESSCSGKNVRKTTYFCKAGCLENKCN